jgi:hypothetical protein
MILRALIFASVPIFGIGIGYLTAGQIPDSPSDQQETESLINLAIAVESSEIQAGEGGAMTPALQEKIERPATFEDALKGLRVFGEPVSDDDRLSSILKMGRFATKVEGRNGRMEVVADIAVEFESPDHAKTAYTMKGIMAVRDHVLFSLVAASGTGEVHESNFDAGVLEGAMMRLLREKDPRIKTVHFVKLTARSAS